MSAAQSIIEKIASLPADKQQEWPDSTFAQFSMQQAMRGLEDETVIYTDDDLKEHWL
jgi:hypothetical protein